MLNPRHTPRVVVVGAGIGGLVSALVLAHRGLDVTLLESAATPGGKIRQVQVDGVGIDSALAKGQIVQTWIQKNSRFVQPLEWLLSARPNAHKHSCRPRCPKW